MYGTYNISVCPITGLQRRTTITEFHAVSDRMVLNCFTERLQNGEPIQTQGLNSFNTQLVAIDNENVTEFTDFKNALLSGNANVPAILESVITNADNNGRFN